MQPSTAALKSFSPLLQAGVAAFCCVVIYLLLAGGQQGNQLVAELRRSDNLGFSSQLFWVNQGGYSEQQSSRGTRDAVTGTVVFPMPELGAVHLLRLDPAEQPGPMLLGEIQVLERSWFSVARYRLRANRLYPVKEISRPHFDGNYLQFSATGNDPFMQGAFEPELIDSRVDLYLPQALSALLVTTVLSLLFRHLRRAQLDETERGKLIIYALFTGLALFKIVYYKDNVAHGDPPDEARHVEYVQYLAASGRVLPQFDDMYAPGSEVMVNTLHPPLYYHLLHLLSEPADPGAAQFAALRDSSAWLAMLAVLALTVLGLRADMSLLAHFTYLSVLGSLPMLGYLGGAVNNDTLAILAGALFALGLTDILKDTADERAWLILLLGGLLAFFAKLTAAMLVLFSALAALGWLLRSGTPLHLGRRRLLLGALFIAPVLYYQAYLWLEYQSLLPPDLGSKDPQGYAKSDFARYGASAARLDLAGWFGRFIQYIREGWFGIHAHRSFFKDSLLQMAPLIALHGFALVALLQTPAARNRAFHVAGKCTLLALLLVLGIQFYKSYQGHLAAGTLGGLQPRYVLPFACAFAMLAAVFVDRLRQGPLVFTAVVALCLGALYYDFPYFLRYY